jgi:hypothetical protein
MMSVYSQMLKTQWTWSRTAVLGFGVITFALPALIWRLAGMGGGPYAAFALIQGFQAMGISLAMLALAGGAVMAATPWTIDAEAKHVYALALPIAWPRFVAIRFGIGVLLLLIPTLALYLGAWFIVLRIDLPDVLQAYPGGLAVRYFTALVVAYAATFAVQYIFGKRAATVVVVSLIAFALVSIALAVIGGGGRFSWIGEFLFEWPGPLAIYNEPWKLIDV